MKRKTLTFVGAVLATYVVAAVLASNSVIASVIAMGLPVDFGTRLEMIGHDVVGMTASYLPLIAVAFLIAFPAAGLLVRNRPALRTAIFILAGIVAVLCIHFALKMTFDIAPVAAARTNVGLALQASAGALGGYLFARFAVE